MPGLKDRLSDAGYGLGWSVVCRLPESWAHTAFGLVADLAWWRALEALPEHARARPVTRARRGCWPLRFGRATHLFAAACREHGAGFSLGFPVDERIQHIVGLIPEQCLHPAIEDDGLRDGAWVAEATGMIDLSSWPEGSRLILRKRSARTPAPS